MQYKLICIDIDGTLINSRHEIGMRTKGAIQLAREKGYIVTLVTGRRYLATVGYARQLGLNLPIICFNGGLIVDSETGRPFHMECIPLDYARKVFAAWSRLQVPVFAYRHSLHPPDVYSENPGIHSQNYLAREGANIKQVPSVEAIFQWDPLRILTTNDAYWTERCYHENEEIYRAGALRTFLTYYEGVANLEIYPEQATKANGLRWLSKHFQVSREQIIAFGDHINDLDMLEWAGLGVAMGNAVPEAKAAADLVTADRDEDGIALVLEDLLTRK